MNGKYGSGAWRLSDINGVDGKEGWIRLIGVGLGGESRGLKLDAELRAGFGRFWGGCLPLLGDEAGGATMVAWGGGRERDGCLDGWAKAGKGSGRAATWQGPTAHSLHRRP